MSRATSKSRSEKGRVTSAQPPPPPQTPEDVDVVPGKLTQTEWMSMISQQEGEDIVAEIVEELMNRVMERCRKVDIDNQLVPFTVAWAKDAMLQVVKLQYLMRDEGDGENTVVEDEEPTPSTIDSWAEGCVPIIRKPAQSQLGCKLDGQDADIVDSQQNQSSLSMKETKTRQKEPRRDKKQSSRAVKLIPAAHAKLELQRKPHPPDTS
ncbi:uncharacterized protein C2orf81 homolog [Astyanax mexicanus]|uniref:uncharacterized protein C2orf81 homolog n=1 Tax=Astyanax mexicanus TaxID=7994 RepID=UPI0020CAC157|nr:uncharacterized protein C2orf81 homolog [Astyanax mexicanus]